VALFDKLPHLCKIQRRTSVKDTMIGRKVSRTVEQTDVECWEQGVSANEVTAYGKLGVRVTSKVYFKSNPNVTDRHEIVLTSRNGAVISAANQVVLQSLLPAIPDASAGKQVLFRVMCDNNPGSGT